MGSNPGKLGGNMGEVININRGKKGMIELNWKQVKNQTFVAGFNKLYAGPYGGKRAYQLGKTKRKLEQEEKTFQEAFKKMLTKYTEIKEDGSYKVPEEKHPEFIKDVEELQSISFQVPMDKIPVNELRCELTPEEILALEPILETSELD